MSKNDAYIPKTHIRHNGTLYAPGEEIPKDRMKKEVAEYHADKGRLEIGGQAEAGDQKKKTDDDPKSKLLAENKDHTIDLVKAAGYPEEEWGELNKEPLIDYYLEKQAEDSE